MIHPNEPGFVLRHALGLDHYTPQELERALQFYQQESANPQAVLMVQAIKDELALRMERRLNP